jgi:hypothetical protein
MRELGGVASWVVEGWSLVKRLTGRLVRFMVICSRAARWEGMGGRAPS